jgi:hypothetical protein
LLRDLIQLRHGDIDLLHSFFAGLKPQQYYRHGLASNVQVAALAVTLASSLARTPPAWTPCVL